MKETDKPQTAEKHMLSAAGCPTPQAGRRGTLLVVAGPSGVGKGTIVSSVLANTPGVFKSVSVTTREKRSGEQDGIEYFFRDEKQFFRMREENQFLEWAEFAGHYYGTPSSWVENQLASGIDVILEIEVQGAKQVRDKCEDAVLVFIVPPSFEELEARLRSRATETAEKISLRLRKGKEEMDERHLFDYEVLNDNLDDAIRNLTHIVYAERLRIR